MKYIRTKDGRIAEIKDNMFVKQSDVLRLVYKDRPYTCVLRGDEDYIIKETDTIEELCDEFVVCLKDGDKILVEDIRSAQDFLFGYGCLRKTECVFGAVWTDKGLIYVAKMNEKGKLCLL